MTLRSIFLSLMACAAFVASAEEPKTADKIVSPTLRAEMGKIVEGIIKDVPEEQEKNLPPGVKDFSEMKEYILKTLDPQLQVTADEETAFAKGEFNDAENSVKMKEYVKTFVAIKIDLPPMTMIFIKEHQDKTLKGVRMELAVRTSEMVHAKIKAAMRK